MNQQTGEVKTLRLLILLTHGMPRLYAEVQSGARIPEMAPDLKETVVLYSDSHLRCPEIGGPWELFFEKLWSTSTMEEIRQ